ncbi:hypothetical protein RSJ13_14240 [Clostridium botulinum]|nr:hypothetical protein RSJ13_14240 [Clostridium botulinum]
MNLENQFLPYLHNTQVPTWDDYAIMSIVKSGLGISILPELISERIPYKIIPKELEIGIAMKDKKTASLAVKQFLHYLKYRNRT